MTATSGQVGGYRWELLHRRRGELFPGVRIKDCETGTNLVALGVDQIADLARAARHAHRASLPIVGWVTRVTFEDGKVGYATRDEVHTSRQNAHVWPTRERALQEGREWRTFVADPASRPRGSAHAPNRNRNRITKITLLPVRQKKAT